MTAFRFPTKLSALKESKRLKERAQQLRKEAERLEKDANIIEEAIPLYFTSIEDHNTELPIEPGVQLEEVQGQYVSSTQRIDRSFYMHDLHEFLKDKSATPKEIYEFLKSKHGEKIHLEAIKSALKRAGRKENSKIVRDPNKIGHYTFSNQK